jgi:hypothetical protein
MTSYGTWVSYSGTAEVALAVVLAAATAAIAYAAVRLPLPASSRRPGRTASVIMLATWVFAIAAFLVCAAACVAQEHREGLVRAAPPNPITPVTLISAGVLFFVIALIHSASGWRVAIGSAVIGAAAAPMIFEFPFDLIVMARTYPPIAPDPALYRLLFFGPLILIELTTLALLSTSPAVRLRRETLWCFAGMLLTFIVWSLSGFGYPSAPGPITLNVLSKILAFVTALTLFLPQRVQSVAPRQEPAGATSGAWSGVM